MNPTTGAAASPGQALRAAREARDLPLHKAADELRLTVEQITAMEEGRYDSLGPAVFARGHLRRYTTLLNLEAGPLLEDYEAAHRDVASPTLVPPASLHTPVAGPRSPLSVAMAVLVPVALAAIVAGAWWLQGRDRTPAAAPEAPAAAETVSAAAESAAPASAQPVAAQGAGQDGASAAGIGDAAPAAPDRNRLALEFSDTCWVEVYDATGERLAFELAGPGAALGFPGPAPWRVMLGNVRGVRMSVAGRSVPLGPRMVVQNTASIYVDEAGTVARVPIAAEGGN